MEFVGLAFSIGGAAAHVSAKIWELAKLWQDAPGDIYGLRDNIVRVEHFFTEMVSGVAASSVALRTAPRAQIEHVSDLLRHGEAHLRELEAIIDRVQDASPPFLDYKPKEQGKKGEAGKWMRKVIWIKKRDRVAALQKQLRDIMLQMCGFLISLNVSMSFEIHSSVDNLHEKVLSRVGDRLDSFQESFADRIEHRVVSSVDRRLEKLVTEVAARLFRAPEPCAGNPWGPFIRGTAKYARSAYSCDADCVCRCHSPRGYRSWTIACLQSVAGSINVSYTGFSSRGSTCDKWTCKSGRLGRKQVRLTYMLPPWLLNRVICLSYGDITGTPEMLLRVVRVVSRDYLSLSDTLFGSIYRGDIENVKRILTQKTASVYDVLVGPMMPPLGIATRSGNTELVKLLLQAGADPFQEVHTRETPIRIAFKNYLRGTDPRTAIYPEIYAFDELLERDDYSELQKVVLGLAPGSVEQLLTQPRIVSTLHHVNYVGQTALHLAALKGNAEITRRLVRAGASVDVKDETGATPLHLACLGGNEGAARALVETGASLNAVEGAGQTPLHFAAQQQDSTSLVLYLLKHGADVNCEDSGGSLATSRCASAGCVLSLECLLDAGANINQRDDDGDNVLAGVIIFNKPEPARLLLQRGVDYKTGNLTGGTPLHLLAAFGRVEMVRVFMEARLTDVDVTLKDDAGMTALQVLNRRGDATPEFRNAFQEFLDMIELGFCADAPAPDFWDDEVVGCASAVEDCWVSEKEAEFFDCVEWVEDVKLESV